MEDIIRFKEDPSIKGVILRINSPGGGVGPTQEIFREVVKLKEKKKVYVSMGSTCASGGYYIASAGEKLYANPSTITGSIGVIMQLMIVEDVLKKIGLKSNTIKAGEFKDAGSPFREMTRAERAYMDKIVQSIYEQFIKDIAAARKMDPERVKKLAEGKIYTGNRAKELGLIDGIGNFYDTVDAPQDRTQDQREADPDLRGEAFLLLEMGLRRPFERADKRAFFLALQVRGRPLTRKYFENWSFQC